MSEYHADTSAPASVKEHPILRHLPTMLHRWRGGYAKMWELTISHKTLSIRVEQSGRVGNLQVSCVGVDHIHGPTVWENAQIEVAAVGEYEYLVYDVKADVQVKCGTVEVKENVEPVHKGV